MSSILKHQGLPICLAVTGFLLGACNPYERRTGDYSAGAVDPITFPSIYLGAGGKGKMPGLGTFQYVIGYVDSNPVSFFPLPFNGKQDTADDPTGQCGRDSNPFDVAVVKPTVAYVFDHKADANGVGIETAPDTDKCTKADGYMFDRQHDAVRFDRQGNIFGALPVDSMPVGCTKYVPIVNEVPVTSMGEPCQDVKSIASLVTRQDVSLPLDPPPDGAPATAMPTGHPSCRYLAYALIDPAADVQPPSCPADGSAPCMCPMDHMELCQLDPVTKLGPQRWGWYQQYLVAYLDGGYIPVDPSPGMDCKSGTCFKSQKLYYPLVWDSMGMMWTDQGFGLGRDVMAAKRGADGYSPICEVYSFQPTDKDPMKSETKASDIEALSPTSTGQFVYCLQTP